MATALEWSKRVQQWWASGVGPAKFCEGQEFTAKALQWWASRFERLGFPGEARAGKARLARVVRVSDAVQGAEETSHTGLVLEVSGVRVMVETGSSRATLSMVLELLGATGGGK